MNRFDEYIRFLDSEKKYSPHTVKAYASDLKAAQDYFKFTIDEHIGLSDLNYPLIRNYIAYLNAQGMSARSINRKMSVLNGYYQYERRNGRLQQNPLEAHKALKTPHSVSVPFSEEEMEQLDQRWMRQDDSFSTLRNRLIIEVLYATGMRRSELIELKTTDLDLERGTLRVLGKGKKERLVPVIESVLVLFKQYIALKTHQFDCPNLVLFITDKGEKLYPEFVYRLVNSYLKEVSVKQKKSPHMLRHTFATHLLNRGADLNTVKELLGHSSLAATQVYTHSSIEELKSVYKSSHPRGERFSS
ncbi:MAG: tyrosine-type recombinase/integrase [Flavobacteriaceae bacterium]